MGCGASSTAHALQTPLQGNTEPSPSRIEQPYDERDSVDLTCSDVQVHAGKSKEGTPDKRSSALTQTEIVGSGVQRVIVVKLNGASPSAAQVLHATRTCTLLSPSVHAPPGIAAMVVIDLDDTICCI